MREFIKFDEEVLVQQILTRGGSDVDETRVVIAPFCGMCKKGLLMYDVQLISKQL